MSKLSLAPYLTFGGRGEEAINFYKEALNAEVEMLMHFKDSPEPIPEEHQYPGYEEHVMHCSLRIGDELLMLSDGCEPGSQSFQGFSLSLSPSSKEEADKLFSALAKGGEVQMPLAKTFWSPYFGMLTDQFGVAWMFNMEEEKAA